jgi:gamma-glutamyltranspeptidase/glutathione hydrolase
MKSQNANTSRVAKIIIIWTIPPLPHPQKSPTFPAQKPTDMTIRTLIFLLCTPAWLLGQRPETGYTIGKRVLAERAAVASAHPEATRAGIEILRRGGNAFDAAIAVQLALAVVYPRAGNLGGGGFMVARTADGRSLSYDYRETAPAKATRDMYLDAAGNPVPDLSVRGPLAAGVPGTVSGLFSMHAHAKLPFSDLIGPAIKLAENGFVLTAGDAASLNRYQDVFQQTNDHLPAFVKPGGWKKGDRLVQPELAATLRRIRDEGRNGFYGGETARLVAAQMRRTGGIMDEADLAAYTTRDRPVLQFEYKGHTILSMGPPSSGGTCLAELMGITSHFPLERYGFHDPRSIHLMVEAERRAYADRAAHLGDPDHWKVPVGLLAPEYWAERAKTVDPQRATPSSGVAAGDFEGEQTTHLSVLDEEGNAVSVTTTLNSNYGCKVVVQGTGFLLNNEMDDFSIKPGLPNQFGLVGAEANAIAPGKRMLSSMTPTIVLDSAGRIKMVVGTPGGATIITSVFQVVHNVLIFGMDLDRAVNAPRFHHQWLPDQIFVEKGAFPRKTVQKLEAMGHRVVVRENIGLVDAILVRKDGRIEAVGDGRGDDAAAGY